MRNVRIPRFILVLAFLALAQAAEATVPPGPPTFVTICHAAGLADEPANFVTLTLPENAVYGQAGHFNENGTPQAGHEQDTLGACPTEETTTTTVVEETTTTTMAPTTTTLTPATTAVTEAPTTTVVVAAPTGPPITELPFTGLDPGLLLGTAVALSATGAALVRRYRAS